MKRRISFGPITSEMEERTNKVESPAKSILKMPTVQFKLDTSNLENLQKMAVAKRRVQVLSLNEEMDKAVIDTDFLKAHQLQMKIANVEEELRKLEKVLPESKGAQSLRVNVVKMPLSDVPQNALGIIQGSNGKKIDLKNFVQRKTKEQERELLKENKKKAKEEEKQEKEKEKERERKEKEAKKEIEKKEKEEEKANKKAEIEKEKLQKFMEEQNKKLEEAEKEKNNKTAQAFKGFFVKKNVEDTKKEEICPTEKSSNFTPFRLKSNMRMAPLVRNNTTLAKNRLDSLDLPSAPSGLYLDILKSGIYKPKNGQLRTWPLESKNISENKDEIEILPDEEDADSSICIMDNEDCTEIEENPKQTSNRKAKLFQFHENNRPAYWGTWAKKHDKIKGRTPFKRDDVLFDYDYESDEDWEEEEQGENLSDEEEKDKEEEEDDGDDEEVDDKFFVPHGYLSDEEEEKDDDEIVNPDVVKEKLKMKEEEFVAEQKKKTKIIKPHVWGCQWEEVEVDSSSTASQLIKVLSPYSSITIGDNNHNNNQLIHTGFTKNSSITGTKCFPEEAMVDLIKLVHANPNSKVFLSKEFMEFCKKSKSSENISKKSIGEKIMEISDYKKTEELKDKKYWVVKPEILEKYKVIPTLPNGWSYSLFSPFSVEERSVSPLAYQAPKTASLITNFTKILTPKPASLITNFTKILSQKERKNISVKPATILVKTATKNKTNVTKSSTKPKANPKPVTKTITKVNPISIRKTTKGTRIKGGKLISFSPLRVNLEKISPNMPIAKNIQQEEHMNVECITLE